MNPYEVLSVQRHATDVEIKNAYRKLIKHYHPDINTSEDANRRVVSINAAYDILSDPEKRARYDIGPYVVLDEHAEDPIEAHRRELKRKRWEKEQRAKGLAIKREKITYRVMRVVAFPMMAFAFLLVLDNLLTHSVHEELPIAGWQERTSRHKKPHRSELRSYMETPHYYMQVPHQLHLSYPYYDDDKPKVTIAATPIFDIPQSVSYIHDGVGLRYDVGGTVHSSPFQLPWLLLISSGFVGFRNEYSLLNYAMCFLPLLIFTIILVVMF